MKAVLRSNPSDIKKKSQYVLHLKGIVVETVVPANVEDLWFPEESVAVFAHATLGDELLPSIKIMNINACARKKKIIISISEPPIKEGLVYQHIAVIITGTVRAGKAYLLYSPA